MPRPEFNDPDLPLSDLYARWPGVAKVFWRRRMLCPGCPIAPFHAIRDACLEYHLDEREFRAELQEWLRTNAAADVTSRLERPGREGS